MLVGAGPGDEKLITVKGMEAIRKADVILYDRLANPKLLTYAKEGCELIYGGKLPKRHMLRQEVINQTLVEKALEGNLVVRLKGGDPNVFGRVGEEAATLAEYGISYEIVPGITSGIAAPAYAGIPVTHRDYGGSFAMVTAHDKSLDGKPSVNWEGLAKGVDTIAFYMGVANLTYICENLIKHGKPATTPVILIQWGTFGRQKTLEGTLTTIADKAEAVQFTNPAITLVGDIVALREKIAWFENKPLQGEQILLARTDVGPSTLANQLTELGADVVEFPKMKKVTLPMNPVRERVLDEIEQYGTILFSNPDSPTIFFEELWRAGKDIRSLKGKIYGTSRRTVKALQNYGLRADFTEQVPEGVQEPVLIVGERSLDGQQWCFALHYTKYELFMTHETLLDESYLPIFQRILEDTNFTSVLFPCSKSVRILQDNLEQKDKILANLTVLCFDEKTAQRLRDCRIQDITILETPDAEGVKQFFIQNGSLIQV